MKVRALILFLALAASRPALAEPETGSRFDRSPSAVTDSANDPVVAKVVSKLARCIAVTRPALSDRLLSMELLSKDQVRLIDKELSGLDQCYQTSQFDLTFHPLSLVGGIAEQRVYDRYKEADVRRLSAINDDTLFASAAAPRTTAEDLASCVVRKDPITARRLIETEPTSADEARLVGKLVPHLGSCVPAGANLKLNRRSVRAYAAIGLYHLMTNEAVLASPNAGRN